MIWKEAGNGTDDDFLEEVLSFLEEIRSSLEELFLPFREVLLLLGGFVLFLRMYLLQQTIVVPGTAKPVFGQITIHTLL